MTPEQRSVIGRRLIALREELLGRGPSKIEPNRRDDATTGVADEDEQALSEMHQVLASQRNAGQADMLARIVRASERLASDPDGFGLCDDCEEEIPFARLEALPYVTLCAACQANHDPPRHVRRRSTTDFSS
jgi:DnaK suppressor protein